MQARRISVRLQLYRSVLLLKKKIEVVFDTHISLENGYMCSMVGETASSNVTHDLQRAECRGAKFKPAHVNSRPFCGSWEAGGDGARRD